MCSVCKKTEGKKADHKYGEWEIDAEATVSESGKMVRSCTVCGDTDSKEYRLNSYIQGNKFIFTPEEFRKLFFNNFVSLEYSRFGGAQVKAKDGQVMVAIIDSSYNNVGNVGFVVDGKSMRMATAKTESGFDGIIMIISEREEFVANAMLAVIMSCDPTISEYGAREVGKGVLSGKITRNGITYSFGVSGNYYTMAVIPAK